MEPKKVKLTKNILDKLITNDIIFAVASRYGIFAVIYIIIEDDFICYWTQGINLIEMVMDILIDDSQYENGIFVGFTDREDCTAINKNATFKIGNDHLIYFKNNIGYKICELGYGMYDIPEDFIRNGLFSGFSNSGLEEYSGMEKLPSEQNISEKRFKKWFMADGLEIWLIEGWLINERDWPIIPCLHTWLKEEELLSVFNMMLEENKSKIEKTCMRLRKKGLLK